MYFLCEKVSQYINTSMWTEIKWDYTEKHYHSLIHRQLKNLVEEMHTALPAKETSAL